MSTNDGDASAEAWAGQPDVIEPSSDEAHNRALTLCGPDQVLRSAVLRLDAEGDQEWADRLGRALGDTDQALKTLVRAFTETLRLRQVEVEEPDENGEARRVQRTVGEATLYTNLLVQVVLNHARGLMTDMGFSDDKQRRYLSIEPEYVVEDPQPSRRQPLSQPRELPNDAATEASAVEIDGGEDAESDNDDGTEEDPNDHDYLPDNSSIDPAALRERQVQSEREESEDVPEPVRHGDLVLALPSRSWINDLAVADIVTRFQEGFHNLIHGSYRVRRKNKRGWISNAEMSALYEFMVHTLLGGPGLTQLGKIVSHLRNKTDPSSLVPRMEGFVDSYKQGQLTRSAQASLVMRWCEAMIKDKATELPAAVRELNSFVQKDVKNVTYQAIVHSIDRAWRNRDNNQQAAEEWRNWMTLFQETVDGVELETCINATQIFAKFLRKRFKIQEGPLVESHTHDRLVRDLSDAFSPGICALLTKSMIKNLKVDRIKIIDSKFIQQFANIFPEAVQVTQWVNHQVVNPYLHGREIQLDGLEIGEGQSWTSVLTQAATGVVDYRPQVNNADADVLREFDGTTLGGPRAPELEAETDAMEE